jgi:prepilin-type N-terminal cleavage/methylation domain-containing protein
MRKGFTLIELLITISLIVALTAVAIYIFRVFLLTWSSQSTREEVGIQAGSAVEQMARDLREASAIQSSGDEIRFTQGADSYIYYLYNSADIPYPPAFNQSSYQLIKSPLTGGIGGTFTYGSGAIKMTDVSPPPVSDLSLSGNVITIDLTSSRSGESIRSRTDIRPRNL